MRLIFLLLTVTGVLGAEADRPLVLSPEHVGVRVGYGVGVPFADWSREWTPGGSPVVACDLEPFVFRGYMLSAEFSYLFASRVFVDPLAPYRTSDGFILGVSGIPVPVTTEKRGWALTVQLGKNWLPAGSWRLVTVGGAGYMAHWFRLKANKQEVPWLSEWSYRSVLDGKRGGVVGVAGLRVMYGSPERKHRVGAELLCYGLWGRSLRSFSLVAEKRVRFDGLVVLRIFWTMLIPLKPEQEELTF